MVDGPGRELAVGEDGALRPLTTTPEGLLSAEEIRLHHSVNSGGSGRGGSFWSGASRCGRRAILSERKYGYYREMQTTLPLAKNHFLVGSLYHTMQESWRMEFPAYETSFSAPWVNVNVQEAARLFKGYRDNWPRHLWGNTLAIEKQMPASDSSSAEVFGHFGAELTGKIDLVVDLQDKHLEAARTRLPDLEPGVYIVDFKTSEQPGTSLGYTLGLQSTIYPLLWNISFPDRPVKGMIFDVVYKRSRRRPVPLTPGDFGAYFAPFNPDNSPNYINQLKGMIQQGVYTTKNFLPNRSECCSWRGDICQFYQRECNAEV